MTRVLIADDEEAAREPLAAAVRVDEGDMHLTLRGRPETPPVSRHFQGLFKGQ